MILFLLLVGFLFGSMSAAVTLVTGGSIGGAFLAYSLGGALGMLIAALFVHIAPLLQYAAGPFAIAPRAERR